MLMWHLVTTDDFERCLKHYQKKRPRELKGCLNKLDTLLLSLNEGADPQRIPHGFIHPEPHGVLALDQRGGGANLSQMRLYVYLDKTAEKAYAITLGDKRSQSTDIQICNRFVAVLQKGRGGP